MSEPSPQKGELQMSDILVVGSLAYDTISTPVGHVDRALGGSANYFSLAASLYAKVRVVGVVGEDYADADMRMLTERSVCTKGLQKQPGQTFHWAGKYQDDMNEAITLATDLNVFEAFDPKLPAEYKNSNYVFLANIDPELQLRVLDQIEKPRFVGSDTMNFWIHSKLPQLRRVLERVDVLLINEGESKLLSKKSNAIAAAQEILKMGPKTVVIKRGEYGFVLYSEQGYFVLPAYPIANVIDPTGAGDTFAGAFFGYLAKENKGYDLHSLRHACIHGCLAASFTVQNFGVEALKNLSWAGVQSRFAEYTKIVTP
jgi:sugar/nucleoside kinase (ribokinase family)